jgi:uncharacterized membrane protein
MSFANRLNAFRKLLLSLAAAVVVYMAAAGIMESKMLRALLAWDVFCMLFLALNWVTFFTTRPQQIRTEARKQDEGRVAVFIIALVATLAALLAIILLLVSKKEGYSKISFPLVVAFGGMMLSWVLVHTVFAVRYAHMFYADHHTRKSEHAGGLDFPGEEHPDFIDFAYFSFVVGMTFQVSDVTISSRKLRRMVLLHSLMAFAFNTVIVALTINVIAGLSG